MCCVRTATLKEECFNFGKTGYHPKDCKKPDKRESPKGESFVDEDVEGKAPTRINVRKRTTKTVTS
jgi:hypothetical protein